MENKAIIALDHLKQLISANEIGGLSQAPSRSWDRTRILKDIVAAIEGCTEASGGGDVPLIVRCTVSNDLVYVLSEDWDTINEAFTEAGRPVLIEFTDPGTKSAVERHTYCLVTEVHSTENFVTEQRSIENASEAKSISGSDYYVVCTNLSNVDFNFKYLFHSDTSSGTLSCSEALTIGGGSGGGMLKVTASVSGEDVVLDKNYNEIVAAMADGGAYIYVEAINGHILNELVYDAFVSGSGVYVIRVPVTFPDGTFVSGSATGLLVYASNSAPLSPT